MAYQPPISDIKFVLTRLLGLSTLADTQEFSDFDPGMIDPILDQAGKLARDVVAPINQAGDATGARLTDNGVKAPPGFAQAYARFRDGGWMGLSVPVEWGGQGLPKVLGLAVMEMFHSANMAFGLCPMLSFGAIEALLAHGTEQQKAKYLPGLVSGKWTGTMNLTEPQAGSDLGALKTKAVANDDDSYAITGQKIYITWGDHDIAENILHLVLARLPDAPEGSGGISLFLVPKFIIGDDDRPGRRNGVKCIGLENKIGIHASPTCTMDYDGATGWLIGKENRGLACMFSMMNSARLNVGLEGVGVAEAARQVATTHAQTRRQGRPAGWNEPAPILHHPDIRRILTDMHARTMAARAICYACAVAEDMARVASTQTERQFNRLRADLLIPIAKAWSTDMAVAVAGLGVQVHGGMGYINETLAAQLYRDVRITPIYEGTNGIQAIDLAGRKLHMADGAAMKSMLDDMGKTADRAHKTGVPALVHLASRLNAARQALDEATTWMRCAMRDDRPAGLAGASAYLMLAGNVIGGYFLVRAALVSGQDGVKLNDGSMRALAGFFAEDTLATAPGMVAGIKNIAPFLSS